MSSAFSWTWTSASLALVVLLAISGPAAATLGEGVEIQATSGEAALADPGGTVSIALRVTSTSDRPVDLRETLQLPEGWRRVGISTGLQLEPGGAATRIFLVTVPPNVRAGAYTIAYTTEDLADPAIRGTTEIDVQVRPVSGVGVWIEPAAVPPFVAAGETVRVPVTVTNHGNHDARFTLEAIGEKRLEATIQPAAVDLAPGESAEVTVVARTSREDVVATTRSIRVHARSASAEERAVLQLPIVPKGSRRAETRGLPASVGLHLTQAGDDLQVQGEVAALGPLDERGRYRMDLLLRGPTAVETAPFGLTDELRLAVSAPYGQVLAGDHLYGSSLLTHPGLYARGGGVMAQHEGIVAAGYHARTRFGDTRRDTGVRVGHTLGERGAISLNVLDTEDRLADTRDTIGTVSGTVRPVKGSEVLFEVGTDAGTEGDGADSAWRLAGTVSRTHRLKVMVDTMRGGPTYSGFVRDVAQTSGTVLAAVSDTVTLTATGLHSRRNLDQDPARGSAPVEDRLEGRAAFRLTQKWTLQPGVAAVRREEQLSLPGLTSWREGAALLAIARIGARWMLHAESRVGPRFVEEEAYLAHQHSAFLTMTPGDGIYGLYGTWGSDDADASVLFAADAAVGASVTWPIVDGLDFTADAQRSFGAERDQLDAILRFQPGRGPILTGRARGTWTDGEPELASQISVVVPFRVPLGAAAHVGRLEGHIVDGADPERPGLAGILVSAGGRVAVTDRTGRFVIDGLTPGQYTLQLDRRTAGMGRVAAERIPDTLEVRSGDETTLTIALIAGARVTGRVVRVGGETSTTPAILGSGEPLASGGVAGLLVQVSDGDETLTRMTTSDGSFSFDGLRPGRWRVTLPASQIPGWHEAVVGEAVLSLAPDGAGEAVLSIRPRTRRMHLAPHAAVEVVSPAE